jgi:hypothetical protein
MKKLIARGYLPQPRSLRRKAEYAERCKLLGMSALYILGTSAGFCSIYPLTHILATEIEKISIVSLTSSWICAMSTFACQKF